MDRKAILAERIRARMHVLDINSVELSKQSGVSQSIISRACTGTCIPNSRNMQKLARCLGTSSEDLLGETECSKSLEEMYQLLNDNLPSYSDREKMDLARFILKPVVKEELNK